MLSIFKVKIQSQRLRFAINNFEMPIYVFKMAIFQSTMKLEA